MRLGRRTIQSRRGLAGPSLTSLLTALGALVLLASLWLPLTADAPGRTEALQSVERLRTLLLLPDADADEVARAFAATARAFGYEVRHPPDVAAPAPLQLYEEWARRAEAALESRRLWEIRAVAVFVAEQHPSQFTDDSVALAGSLTRRIEWLPGLALIVLAVTLLVQFRRLHPVLALLVVAAGGFVASLMFVAQPATTLPGTLWGPGAFAVLLGSLTWVQCGLATLITHRWVRNAP